MNNPKKELSAGRIHPLAWISFAGVILSVVCFSLVRISPTDVSWHLATARLAFSSGSYLGNWPIENTFSYTHGKHPLLQQYPLFHTAIYLVDQYFGWEGLSIFHSSVWVLIFIVWIWWSGGIFRAARWHILWAFVALGLQQRMSLRPEIFTLLLMPAMLLAIDIYRSAQTYRRRILAISGIVLVQWAMTLSHQLFIVGFVFQFALVAHLIVVKILAGRFGVASTDLALPLIPVCLGILGSVIVSTISPLGLKVFEVPFATIGTLAHHGSDVNELMPISELPFVQFLLCVSAILVAIGFWNNRLNWQPFEVAILVVGVIMAMAGWRGVSFFVVIACSIASRNLCLNSGDSKTVSLRRAQRLEFLKTLTTCSFVIFVVCVRWILPQNNFSLEATQSGIGKSLGQWPDQAMRFLDRYPPPGEVLNLGWYSGNYLIFYRFPKSKVFVDPRFEAYPREFLLGAISAENNTARLEELIQQFNPQWFLGEVRLPQVIERGAELVASGQWELVYFDDIVFILVRKTRETEEYLNQMHDDRVTAFAPDQSSELPELRRRKKTRIEEFTLLFKQSLLKSGYRESLPLLERLNAE